MLKIAFRGSKVLDPKPFMLAEPGAALADFKECTESFPWGMKCFFDKFQALEDSTKNNAGKAMNQLQKMLHDCRIGSDFNFAPNDDQVCASGSANGTTRSIYPATACDALAILILVAVRAQDGVKLHIVVAVFSIVRINLWVKHFHVSFAVSKVQLLDFLYGVSKKQPAVGDISRVIVRFQHIHPSVLAPSSQHSCEVRKGVGLVVFVHCVPATACFIT